MSLIPSSNTEIKNPKDLRFQTDITAQTPNTWNNTTTTEKNEEKPTPTPTNNENDKNKNNNENNLNKEEIKKEVHKLTILSPKINSKTAWKIFNIKYHKLTSWTIETVFYNDLQKYNKDLIYKLATKNNDFDLAIIPAEWFENTDELSKLSFKLKNADFEISSLFDYNFQNFLKNNNIKAIPFAIDPIVGFTLNKEIKTLQTYESWKKIIITNYKRLDKNWKLKYMPLFLGYDNNYLKYIEKNNKTLFPVFDYITIFYKFKKDRTGLSLMKDFWQNITYKTFDFNLYKKNLIKFRKNSICKGKMIKYCLLLSKNTDLVYGFSSDYNILKENWLKIYKSFKVKTKNLNLTSLAIGQSTEYPARWRIIIINPHSNNLKYISVFLKKYMEMWQKWELPFYKNMISPFLAQSTIKNKKIIFMEKYYGRFITLDKIWVGIKNTLNKKIINYLKWDISIDILLR